MDNNQYLTQYLSEDDKDFILRVGWGRRLKMADRVQDRVRQRVKKFGLAEVVINPRRWVLTPKGLDLWKSLESKK